MNRVDNKNISTYPKISLCDFCGCEISLNWELLKTYFRCWLVCGISLSPTGKKYPYYHIRGDFNHDHVIMHELCYTFIEKKFAHLNITRQKLRQYIHRKIFMRKNVGQIINNEMSPKNCPDNNDAFKKYFVDVYDESP